MNLYLYVNLTRPEQRGWFRNPQKFREEFETYPRDIIVRCAHPDIAPPKGYHKPNGHLACDAVERIPTMQDLINKL